MKKEIHKIRKYLKKYGYRPVPFSNNWCADDWSIAYWIIKDWKLKEVKNLLEEKRC